MCSCEIWSDGAGGDYGGDGGGHGGYCGDEEEDHGGDGGSHPCREKMCR